MDTHVRTTLKRLIDEYGIKITINPQLLEGLLRNFCEEHRREINVLMAAVRAEIPKQIIHMDLEEVDEFTINQMVKKLYELEGIAEHFGLWAVKSWCYALGKSKIEPNYLKNARNENSNYEKVVNRKDIKIIGIGGGGVNFIKRVSGEKIDNAEFVAIHTKPVALNLLSDSHRKLAIGKQLTRGLGSGGNPKTGESAAKESMDSIKSILEGAKLVIFCTGMGGGTGTGATPAIAEMAKNMGASTVAFVTTPFIFEGRKLATNSEEGIKKLKPIVDQLTIISNDSILNHVDRNTPMIEAFKYTDRLILDAIKESINQYR